MKCWRQFLQAFFGEKNSDCNADQRSDEHPEIKMMIEALALHGCVVANLLSRQTRAQTRKCYSVGRVQSA